MLSVAELFAETFRRASRRHRRHFIPGVNNLLLFKGSLQLLILRHKWLNGATDCCLVCCCRHVLLVINWVMLGAVREPTVFACANCSSPGGSWGARLARAAVTRPLVHGCSLVIRVSYLVELDLGS